MKPKRCHRGEVLHTQWIDSVLRNDHAAVQKVAWLDYENHRDGCLICRAGDGGHTQPLQVAEVKK